jgi:hypothetical protein
VTCVAPYRIDGVELRHQHFTRLQAIGHRSSVEQPGFAQHGAGNRIERIEADRYGLLPGDVVVDQDDKSMLAPDADRPRRDAPAPSPSPTILSGGGRTFVDRRRCFRSVAACRISSSTSVGKTFRQEQTIGRGRSELQCTTPSGDSAGKLRASAATPMTGAMRASESSSSTYQAALPSHQAVEAKTPSEARALPARRAATRRGQESMPTTHKALRGGSLPQSHARRRRQKTEAEQAERRRSGTGQSHKVRSPP